MKKIILFCAVFGLFLFNQTSAITEEFILHSKDGFEIKTPAVISDDNGRLSLIKNSNLTIVFSDDSADFEYDEPKVSFTIKNKDGAEVRSLKTPSIKMSGDSPQLEQYLVDNQEYFDQVRISQKTVEINTPLDFQSGEYILSLNIKMGDKEKKIEYKINLSKSAYSFSDFDMTLEDKNFLATINYSSFVDTEEEYVVSVSLLKEGAEIFRKEMPKVFYQEGAIVIDEKIDTLKDIEGEVLFKIEIKDKDGEVIYEKSEKVNSEKAKNAYQYFYYAVILILLSLAFVVLKKVKAKKIKLPLVILLFALSSISLSRVYAVETCGGVNKPQDFCFEDKVVTYVCKNTYTCDVDDSRLKKYFSTGTILNIPSDREWVGPVSATVNVCNNIGQTLNTGDNFYVISDSKDSDWQKKKFHIFRFTKGTTETQTFDPGGDKRNVNYATYNGGCSVTVYGRYSGGSSSYKNAKTTIIETGKVTSNICKSAAVTTDLFESKGSLLDKTTCTKTQLRDTWIAGGVYVEPQFNPSSSWQDKTVNICNYLGYTAGTIPEGEAFYALMEQTSSWTTIDYPIFRFVFGTENHNYDKTLNGNDNSKAYYYGAYKENVPTMRYDGECNVTFRLYKYGESTDSWVKGYKLIEVGMIENATCRDEHIVESSTASNDGAYLFSGRGLSNGEVEQETKRSGGKYEKIAGFIRNLSNCVGVGQCSLTGDWIRSYTDTSCSQLTCDNTHTEGSDAGCSVNNKEETWMCLNGTWTETETTNLCTTLTCTASEDVVEAGDSVTYTANAIPGATYKWWSTPTAQIAGQTAVNYTATFSTTGLYQRRVTATNGTTVQSKDCPNVYVGCIGSKPADSECINNQKTVYDTMCDSNGVWGSQVVACVPGEPDPNELVPYSISFKFDPDVTNGTQCPLDVVAGNSQLCRIKNRTGSTFNLTDEGTSDNEFLVDNELVNIGVYTLECASSSTVPVWTAIGAGATCSSNPSIREN